MKNKPESSSQTLYRKYRPSNFDQILGQENVVFSLKNSIKENKISHAYIFSGGRGTGKTSTARIFATELGTSLKDLYEVDAASNRGIDDIREIKESVHTLPFDSQYKIYIIDEAHMLTKEAWNALLKTLEEPPRHVVFILATTELGKIPETILSRCQVLNFKEPSNLLIERVISETAKKEGIKMDKEALEIMALLSDGSFRDAHGVLQRAINISDSNVVTLKDIETFFGIPKKKSVQDFIDSLLSKNIQATLSILRQINEENLDVKIFSKPLLENLRDILILKIDPKYIDKLKLKLGEDSLQFIFEMTKKENTNLSSELVKIFLEADSQISRSFIEILPLELAVIKIGEKEFLP